MLLLPNSLCPSGHPQVLGKPFISGGKDQERSHSWGASADLSIFPFHRPLAVKKTVSPASRWGTPTSSTGNLQPRRYLPYSGCDFPYIDHTSPRIDVLLYQHTQRLASLPRDPELIHHVPDTTSDADCRRQTRLHVSHSKIVQSHAARGVEHDPGQEHNIS